MIARGHRAARTHESGALLRGRPRPGGRSGSLTSRHSRLRRTSDDEWSPLAVGVLVVLCDRLDQPTAASHRSTRRGEPTGGAPNSAPSTVGEYAVTSRQRMGILWREGRVKAVGRGQHRFPEPGVAGSSPAGRVGEWDFLSSGTLSYLQRSHRASRVWLGHP